MKVKDAKVFPLFDFAQLAQTQIQQDMADIDPVVTINSSLRKSGVAAEVLTVGNPKTNKHILMILHDDKPDIVDYDFGLSSEDPAFNFNTIHLSELTQLKLYERMKTALA